MKHNVKPSYTLAELADYLNADLIGDADHVVYGLADLKEADSGQVSFWTNPAYRKHLSASAAGAVILRSDAIDDYQGNRLITANPYLAYARLTALFDPTRGKPATGIHPSVVLGKDCHIGRDVSIGPYAVIGDNVVLGDGVIIGSGCSIGDDSRIGDFTRLAANVVIYHGITVGTHCIVHGNAVIGSDGFGFAPDPETRGWQKIHQLGAVIIGNHVEIGSCTCIDRGALTDTRIDDGVKIDNQVHIAHNVQIGKNSAIAAKTGIAGSSTVGQNCTLAGAVGVVDHLDIGDNVHVTGMTMVNRSLTEPGSYSSGILVSSSREWRKNAIRFGELDALVKRVKKLEKTQDT